MQLKNICDSFEQSGENSWKVTIPSTWMQGRTCYGGLSSALAHHAARLCVPDAPPLRSGQVSFVGPMAGEVELRAELLRRGRNTAFVEVKILSNGGVGFLANFIFMNPRDSKISFDEDMKNGGKAELPPIPAEEDTRNGPPEFFAYNFDYPNKRLSLGQGSPKLANWHRLRERDGLDPMAEIICMGDVLPPSAMGLMEEKAMVSSMNWQFNMHTAQPGSENGWYYCVSETHHAENGASSQYMRVYNEAGERMMSGMQSVALFI